MNPWHCDECGKEANMGGGQGIYVLEYGWMVAHGNCPTGIRPCPNAQCVFRNEAGGKA